MKNVCRWMLPSLLSLLVATSAIAKDNLELGLNAGTPGGINGVVGLWGNDSFPFLVRAYGGSAVFTVGAGAEIGYVVYEKDTTQHYVAVGADASAGISPALLSGYQFAGIGPRVGLNFDGLMVGAGVNVGSGDALELSSHTEISIFPVVNVGYSFRI